jgi:hypothetical protein
MNVEWKNLFQDPIEKLIEDLLEVSTCPLAYKIYNMHPLALQMRMHQSDRDTPTFNDVLKMDADEQSKWYDAMDAELSSAHVRGAGQTTRQVRQQTISTIRLQPPSLL